MIKEQEIKNNKNDYLNEHSHIEEAIRTNQTKAFAEVNSIMINTFYEIGTIINQRKSWGNKYIEKLASDLKEFGKCYSTQNLQYMRQFAEAFTNDEIMQHPVAQIPWRSIITILEKCKNHNEQLWYVSACKKNGWSNDMLLNQIAMKAYERSIK